MVGGSIALLFLLSCTTPVIGGEGVLVGHLAVGQILSLPLGYLGTTGWLLCGACESVQ